MCPESRIVDTPARTEISRGVGQNAGISSILPDRNAIWRGPCSTPGTAHEKCARKIPPGGMNEFSGRARRPRFPDVRCLSRLQRHPVCAGRSPRRGTADRSRCGAGRLHRPLHGQDGWLCKIVFPGVPARRRVRQGDRAFRLLQIDRGCGDRPRRQRARDAGDRAGLRGPDLWRRLAVRRGVRRLSLCRGNVPRRQYSKAPDPRHHRARRLFLHHGFAALQPADPEHHSDHLLQDHQWRGADPRHVRRDLHLRVRHDLSRMAPPPGGDCGRRLWRGPQQRAAARRHHASGAGLHRLSAADRGVPGQSAAGRFPRRVRRPDRSRLWRELRSDAGAGPFDRDPDCQHQGDLGGGRRADRGHPHGVRLRVPVTRQRPLPKAARRPLAARCWRR